MSYKSFETFSKEVASLSKAEYCLDFTEEATPAQLSESYMHGDTPAEFIEWYANKYDLDALE